MRARLPLSCVLKGISALPAATLDGLLLRVLPAVIYSIPFYPMIGFQSDPAHVALFFCVLAVFSATVGALSMAITVGFGTAGKAALIMNLVRFQISPPCTQAIRRHNATQHGPPCSSLPGSSGLPGSSCFLLACHLHADHWSPSDPVPWPATLAAGR